MVSGSVTLLLRNPAGARREAGWGVNSSGLHRGSPMGFFEDSAPFPFGAMGWRGKH